MWAALVTSRIRRQPCSAASRAVSTAFSRVVVLFDSAKTCSRGTPQRTSASAKRSASGVSPGCGKTSPPESRTSRAPPSRQISKPRVSRSAAWSSSSSPEARAAASSPAPPRITTTS